jgi:hypothetical protein
MKIEPTYITFEQAKWLQEKGFDVPTYGYYNGLNFYLGEYKNHSQTTIGDTPMHKRLIGYVSAPEQWQVVEWLRVNHGIWVSPGIITLNGVAKWFARYFKVVNGLLEIPKDIDDNFDTPQEAYSALFDYILKELI